MYFTEARSRQYFVLSCIIFAMLVIFVQGCEQLQTGDGDSDATEDQSSVAEVKPIIDSISGNGASLNIFTDALIVNGANFSTKMTVVLIDQAGKRSSLTYEFENDGKFSATLPEDLTEGEYKLLVQNETGAAESDLTILKGEKGDKGDKGDPGDQGSTGETGPVGPQGDQGLSIVWLGSLTVRPANPGENVAYYDESLGVSFVYSQSEWRILAQNGNPGAPAPKNLVDFAAVAPGVDCPGGGIEVVAGLDDGANYEVAGNGFLEAGEVLSRRVVCNGTNGTMGAVGQTGAPGLLGSDALIDMNIEDPGVNCNNGGFKIETGTDTDGDGLLNPTETLATSHICNGQNGATGATGATGDTGLVGASGVSLLWQGSLASAPASPALNWAYYNTNLKTSYIWNGTIWQVIAIDGTVGMQGSTGATGATGATGVAGQSGVNGLNSLINITLEAAGTNCTNGGQKIESGLDDGLSSGMASDNILQLGEIDATKFICNGVGSGGDVAYLLGPFGAEEASIPEELSVDSSGWGTTTNGAYSGTASFSESPDGQYADNLEAILQTTSPLLIGDKVTTLEYALAYELEENYDYLYVETMALGETWQPLRTYTGSADWTEESVDLSDYAGRQIFLRFRVTTDGSVTEDGVYLDDIRISKNNDIDLPQIISDPPTYVALSAGLSYQLETGGGKGPYRYYLLEGSTAIALDRDTGLLTWSPDSLDLGVHPVSLVVIDSAGMIGGQWFDLTVGNHDTIEITDAILNGETMTSEPFAITVLGGEQITGTVTIDVFNNHGAGAIFPVGWSWSWAADHSVGFGEIDSWANTGHSIYDVLIDVTAPAEAGEYYLAFAANAQYGTDFVFASKCGSTTPTSDDWNNGNDIADLGDQEYLTSNGQHWVSLASTDGDCISEPGLALIRVVVGMTNQLFQETFEDSDIADWEMFSSATLDTEYSIVNSGSYSGHVTSTPTGGYESSGKFAPACHSFTPQSDVFTIEFDGLIDSMGGDYNWRYAAFADVFPQEMSTDPYNRIDLYGFIVGGVSYLSNTISAIIANPASWVLGGEDTGFTYTAMQWNHFKFTINVPAGSYGLVIDSQDLGEYSFYRVVSSVSYICFGTEYEDFYIDNVVVNTTN